MRPERLAELAAQCDHWAEWAEFRGLDKQGIAEFRELAAYLRASVPREVAEQLAEALERSQVFIHACTSNNLWAGINKALAAFAPYRTAEPKE